MSYGFTSFGILVGSLSLFSWWGGDIPDIIQDLHMFLGPGVTHGGLGKPHVVPGIKFGLNQYKQVSYPQ